MVARSSKFAWDWATYTQHIQNGNNGHDPTVNLVTEASLLFVVPIGLVPPLRRAQVAIKMSNCFIELAEQADRRRGSFAVQV